MNRFGLNADGQIAFYALLSDGREGIFLASPSCSGDLDDSGGVGFTDLLTLLAAWGSCAGCPEDLDDSGDVTFADLLALLANWGSCE